MYSLDKHLNMKQFTIKMFIFVRNVMYITIHNFSLYVNIEEFKLLRERKQIVLNANEAFITPNPKFERSC